MAVQIQYDKKVAKLEKENQELKEIFAKVKHLHMVNTRETAKNDYLDIMNYYRDKISELLSKKVDLSVSFEEGRDTDNRQKVQEADNSRKYSRREGDDAYVTEDLNRCKLG
jgi:hypothetical protein